MKVFLVDDSLIIRQRLTRFLSNLGQVRTLGESQEAPDAIARISQLKPDVVIRYRAIRDRDSADSLRVQGIA